VNFSKVESPWWNDKPTFIIGGGASLKGTRWSRFGPTNAYKLCVNQAMLDVPSCNAGITVDSLFFKHRRADLDFMSNEVPVYIAMGEVEDPLPHAHHLKLNWGGKLSDAEDSLNSIGSSGYAAVNLAYLKGSKLIVLFGFDYGITGGTHYHSEYPWRSPTNDLSWKTWAAGYESMVPQLEAAGVTIINASPNSAITCFKKISVDEGLLYGYHPQYPQQLKRQA
jgi:hypothetical protein